jgi:hypothetical protein
VITREIEGSRDLDQCGRYKTRHLLAVSGLLLLSGLNAHPASGQPVVDTSGLPLTVAEASDFTRTATFEDVWDWLRMLQSSGADIYVWSQGTTTEGREMPLAVASRPLVTTPAEAHASGKPILYLQGNIHAGEVEGKDALLMLLRDVTLGEAQSILDEVILLVNPIYNADGNEKWAPVSRNRRGQNGPEEVGIRYNGMGLDLNRDYMKVEAPETRNTFAGLINKWRPHIFMDLHTTNGSRHGYDLTYAAPMTPTAPQGPVRFTNNVMLVELRERLAGHGHAIFDYGNHSRGQNPPTSWRTFSWQPRFASNYMGMRGMISILSEAVSYRPFRTRLSATYWLVREAIRFAGEHSAEIIGIVREAEAQIVAWGNDPSNAPALGVRYELVSRGREMVTYEVMNRSADPSGRGRGEPTGRIEEAEMEIFTVYQAVDERPFPAGYMVPVAYPEAIDLMMRHGIAVERLEESWRGTVQVFRVDSLNVAGRPYQGHRLITIFGDYRDEEFDVPEGWYFIPAAQPLGALVFTLLEPEIADGLAAWNYFDRSISARRDSPVLKLMQAPDVARSRLVDRTIR